MSRETPIPSNAELEILRILWKRGASTVREVHEQLKHERDVGYTTVLKTMQVMAALSDKRASREDLRKIRKLLDESSRKSP